MVVVELVRNISWYSTNIVTTSVFDALSIGSGLVTAVSQCIKRDAF